MYFLNQTNVDARNKFNELFEKCEKEGLNPDDFMSLTDINEIWEKSDIETRDWFSCDEAIHCWEDGYAIGDSDEKALNELAEECGHERHEQLLEKMDKHLDVTYQDNLDKYWFKVQSFIDANVENE